MKCVILKLQEVCNQCVKVPTSRVRSDVSYLLERIEESRSCERGRPGKRERNAITGIRINSNNYHFF